VPQLSESQLLQPEHIFEKKFRIVSTIGAGGVGVIYKAQHLHTKRMLAIKMLHSADLEQESEFLRFQQEAEAASHLNHKNIVTIHDFGVTSDDVAFLVMEYLDGPTLDQIIKTDGRISIERFMQIFPQVCAGLQHAHKKGIVHRDIKPSNLMIVDTEDEKDVVKIVDFGLAKPSQQDVEKHLTQTGIVLGTPLFMSPEQCRGRELDFRTDIYSLGCVMYAALTGKYPFEGESTMDTLYLHIAEPPPPFSQTVPELNLPHSLETVIFKALSKEPSQRPASMQELSQDLVAALASAKTSTRTMPTRSVSDFVKISKTEDNKAESSPLAKTLRYSQQNQVPGMGNVPELGREPGASSPPGTGTARQASTAASMPPDSSLRFAKGGQAPTQALRYSQPNSGSNSGGSKKALTLTVVAATITLVFGVSVMHQSKHEAAIKNSTNELASNQASHESSKTSSVSPEPHHSNGHNKSSFTSESKPEEKSSTQKEKNAAIQHNAAHTEQISQPPLNNEQEALRHKLKGERFLAEKNYGEALPELQAWLGIERQIHGEYAPQLLAPISRVIAALHAEQNDDTARAYLSQAETIVQSHGVSASANTVANKVAHPESVWRPLAQASFHLAGLYGKDDFDLAIQQYKWSLDFFELAFKTWNEPGNAQYIAAQQNAQRAQQIIAAGTRQTVFRSRQQAFGNQQQAFGEQNSFRPWRRRLERFDGSNRH
jgi:serine/threonine protein kinase